MKTLKCKNCDGKIEWKYGTGQKEFVNGTVTYTIGCPNCRQNVIYSVYELNRYYVDEPVVNDVEDTVNHPSHYNQGKIKVADYAEQVVAHYTSVEAPHIYNAIKYISRAPHKGTKDADIDKAINSLIRAKTGEWKE